MFDAISSGLGTLVYWQIFAALSAVSLTLAFAFAAAGAWMVLPYSLLELSVLAGEGDGDGESHGIHAACSMNSTFTASNGNSTSPSGVRLSTPASSKAVTSP